MNKGRHEKNRQYGKTDHRVAIEPLEPIAQQHQRQHTESRKAVIPNNRAEKETFLTSQHQAASRARGRGIPEAGKKTGPIISPADTGAAIGTTPAGGFPKDIGTKLHPDRLSRWAVM